jgi:CheY-like chemotaxis protein
VLVVDDEHGVADSVAEILNDAGFSAEAVYSGPSALDAVRSECPAVLLCDVLMPQLNGVETAKAVRELCPGTRIVLFSGHAATADILARAQAEGLEFEFLKKPIHPDELVRRLACAQSKSSDGEHGTVSVADDAVRRGPGQMRGSKQRLSVQAHNDQAGFALFGDGGDDLRRDADFHHEVGVNSDGQQLPQLGARALQFVLGESSRAEFRHRNGTSQRVNEGEMRAVLVGELQRVRQSVQGVGTEIGGVHDAAQQPVLEALAVHAWPNRQDRAGGAPKHFLGGGAHE